MRLPLTLRLNVAWKRKEKTDPWQIQRQFEGIQSNTLPSTSSTLDPPLVPKLGPHLTEYLIHTSRPNPNIVGDNSQTFLFVWQYTYMYTHTFVTLKIILCKFSSTILNNVVTLSNLTLKPSPISTAGAKFLGGRVEGRKVCWGRGLQ